jgi:drug/metabolite transporter (DMT)-like permease
MNPASLIRLVLLGAIWGASFLFTRVAVPSFGAPALVEIRLASAALFLALVAVLTRKSVGWRQWPDYLAIGAINTALPFLLFAYAARSLPASILSLFNSLAPIFGAIVAAIWFKTSVSRGAATGLASGVLGVAVLTSDHLIGSSVHGDLLALAFAFGAATLAPVCYAIAGAYIKWRSSDSQPFAKALGSMWTSALLILPLAYVFLPSAQPSEAEWGAAVILGIVCTGVAYILYFRLIADIGPMQSLSVAFLIPAFGVLWGVVFLDEPIGWSLFIGGALILLGTALATGLIEPALKSKVPVTSAAGP